MRGSTTRAGSISSYIIVQLTIEIGTQKQQRCTNNSTSYIRVTFIVTHIGLKDYKEMEELEVIC